MTHSCQRSSKQSSVVSAEKVKSVSVVSFQSKSLQSGVSWFAAWAPNEWNWTNFLSELSQPDSSCPPQLSMSEQIPRLLAVVRNQNKASSVRTMMRSFPGEVEMVLAGLNKHFLFGPVGVNWPVDIFYWLTELFGGEPGNHHHHMSKQEISVFTTFTLRLQRITLILKV